MRGLREPPMRRLSLSDGAVFWFREGGVDRASHAVGADVGASSRTVAFGALAPSSLLVP